MLMAIKDKRRGTVCVVDPARALITLTGNGLAAIEMSASRACTVRIEDIEVIRNDCELPLELARIDEELAEAREAKGEGV